MNKEKVSKVLEMIAQDMKDDAKNFDGQPFTGRTVAKYFGNQGAAIAALASIIKDLVNEEAAQPVLAKAESEKSFMYGVALGIANADDDPPSA